MAKAPTKTEVVTWIAEATELSKADVTKVIDSLQLAAANFLSSCGTFKLNNVVQLKRAVKKATPAHDGTHPFTKQPHHFDAKPERVTVKATVLKAMKDSVSVKS